MKILHIGIDSHFVDFLVTGFERHAPGCNELIIASGTEPVGRTSVFTGPTSWIATNASGVAEARERAEGADVVVVHAMSDFAALVCATLPERIIVVWSGFGYDYYVGAAAEDLVGEATQRLLRRVTGGRVLDSYGRPVLVPDLERLEPVALDVVRASVASRTAFFSAPAAVDDEVIRIAFPGFGGEYRQLYYGDLDSMARTGDAVVTGDDILLGNSSSWANNHIEAFRLLAKTDLGSRRVVVPLTYGDPEYREGVIEAGERVLGDNFHPIVDHLPLEEYLQVMAGCGITYFNHRRQQGVGNLVAALQQGSRVYLHRANPLYRWLRSLGFEVSPARDLLETMPTGPVADDVLERHRAILRDFWGPERVEASLRSFIDELRARVRAAERRSRPSRGILGRRSGGASGRNEP